MFASKLFRAALAPLALTAALATSEAAYAQATPYNVFAYAIGGPRTDPCSIYYAIAPTTSTRYTVANGYTLVRTATDRATAQQFLQLFSKHHNNRPDGVVKLAPCQLFTGTSTRPGTTSRGPGGISRCTYLLSKYTGLLQKVHVPEDRGLYGRCHRYGYWNRTHYRGHTVQPGYWVYADGTWYIFSERKRSMHD